MTTSTRLLFPTLILSTFLALLAPEAGADEIRMKSGQTYNGRITYEADDIVKIEIQISASIKETKILSRAEILNIVKDAPDDVAFNELQKILPTRSLMSAEAYRSAITKGPDSFLRSFPESVHVSDVKKIKATLEEELDKVEGGHIKIEDDWISPQEKRDFSALIESRIRLLKMSAYAEGGTSMGLINAMREYEALEENYYGTPAFAKGVKLARQIIPTLGGQLQGMNRDVDYRNAEWEKNKAALDEVSRAQVEAAREREQAQFEAALAADKKAGIKWVRLNPRNKASIEGYLNLAKAELKKLETYDTDALEKQGAMLVEVDELIAKNNLQLARAKLTEAAKITGQSVGSKKSSRTKRSGTYIATLNTKINEKLAAEEAAAKARADAEKSKALTANLKGAPKDGDKEKADGESDDPEAEPGEAAPEESPSDAFAALAEKKDKPKAKEEDKKKSSKSSSKKKDDDDEDRDEEREERPRPSASGGGGGFPSWIIPAVLVVVLVVAVGLKYLGIGGKKE